MVWQILEKQNEMSIQELCTKILCIDETYSLRDNITLEGMDFHPLIRPKVAMTYISSKQIPAQPIEKSSKFIEISSNDDKFSFLPKAKKKPSIVTKTNSQFVQKIVANENLAKVIGLKTGTNFYMYFNVGKALVWADYEWSLVCKISSSALPYTGKSILMHIH